MRSLLPRVLSEGSRQSRFWSCPGFHQRGDVTDWFAGRDPIEAAEELCILAERAPEFSLSGDTDPSNSSAEVVVIEALPVFAERVNQKPPVKEVVRDLHSEDSIGLSHGQPRDGKTIFEQHMALCIALGRPVLGIDRFSVSSQPVVYLTEEDSERRTLERFDAMLRGFGIDKRPENFFVAVRRGISLDEATWQRYLIKATKEMGFKYVVIDPLRSFTAHADQGPSELKPVVLFLRRFMSETGCSVRLVHHDTKPMPGKGDDRKRAHRASGGGIFSIADSPLSFERISDNQTLVVPCGFKHSETPEPFRFTLKTEHKDSRLVSMRLEGADVLRSEAEALSINEAILEFIKKAPGKSGSAIATAIGKRKDHVLVALKQLLVSGRVDGVERGKSTLWFLRSN